MRVPPQLNRPPSLTDVVVMHIRDAIVSGDYAPGQALAEAPLAQALGTSRGTVREALRVLANLGLVSRSSHREPIVTLLTARRAREIYTLRALLESFAARLAVEEGRLDELALAELEKHIQEIAAAGELGGVPRMVEADIEFHWKLSSLAGNDLLMEHLAAIQTHSRRLLVYSDLYRPDFKDVVERHRDLIRILRAADPEAVERAVENHITEVGRTIEAKMSAAAKTASERDLEAAGGAEPSGGGDAGSAERRVRLRSRSGRLVSSESPDSG